MVILGINAYHGDVSAAIVCDGRLVAAIEEERFRRVKHWAGFPTETIRYCLKAGGMTAQEIGIAIETGKNIGNGGVGQADDR